MMTARGLAPILLAATLVPPAFAAEPPAAKDLAARVVAAAGGQEAFAALGVLELDIHEEETTSEGTTRTADFTAYVDSARLDNLRLEMKDDVVLAATPGGGWASVKGKVDDRPQAPRMAAGTARQKLFPLLLPFSLAMDGISYGEVHGGEVEGTPVWYLTVTFQRMFFTSPLMSAPWYLTVRQSDDALLSAEFLPPTQFRNVKPEGVRYRYMKTSKLEGLTLPEQVLYEGIDAAYRPTNHFQVVKLATSVHGPTDPALFMNPDELEKQEEGDPTSGQGAGAQHP